MESRTKAIWAALGRLLMARRVQLDPAWTNRKLFAEDNQLSRQYRTISDIETGRRDDYSAPILALIERAYRYETGSIARYLQNDGDPKFLVESDRGGEVDDPTEAAARAWIAEHPAEAMREVMRAAMRDPAVREELGL